jgi:hypothetical protein
VLDVDWSLSGTGVGEARHSALSAVARTESGVTGEYFHCTFTATLALSTDNRKNGTQLDLSRPERFRSPSIGRSHAAYTEYDELVAQNPRSRGRYHVSLASIGAFGVRANKWSGASPPSAMREYLTRPGELPSVTTARWRSQSLCTARPAVACTRTRTGIGRGCSEGSRRTSTTSSCRAEPARTPAILNDGATFQTLSTWHMRE